MTKRAEDARVGNPGMIKVIGIGQSFRGDDAAGLEAVRLWQEAYLARSGQQNVFVELAEMPGIGLLSLLEGSHAAILVDAMRSQAAPGTTHIISEHQLEAFGAGSGSAHGWGVAESLYLGRQIMHSRLPQKMLLIGIEAGQLHLGEMLSPEVLSALPRVVDLIEQYVSQVTSKK